MEATCILRLPLTVLLPPVCPCDVGGVCGNPEPCVCHHQLLEHSIPNRDSTTRSDFNLIQKRCLAGTLGHQELSISHNLVPNGACC